MQDLMLKKKLLEEGIRKHQSVIDDFTSRLRELSQSERMTYEDEFDGGQLAQKEQIDVEILALNDQLEFANEEIKLLQKMNSTPIEASPQTTLGSVVVTDKNTFFVSTSIEEIELNGRTYLGLSTHSPLFKVMKGKKQGDLFKFNTETYNVREVF